MKIMDYTDEIENAIIDYCLKHNMELKDVPLNVFDLSRHVNHYVNIKNEEQKDFLDVNVRLLKGVSCGQCGYPIDKIWHFCPMCGRSIL